PDQGTGDLAQQLDEAAAVGVVDGRGDVELRAAAGAHALEHQRPLPYRPRGAIGCTRRPSCTRGGCGVLAPGRVQVERTWRSQSISAVPISSRSRRRTSASWSRARIAAGICTNSSKRMPSRASPWSRYTSAQYSMASSLWQLRRATAAAVNRERWCCMVRACASFMANLIGVLIGVLIGPGAA